jgi:hypothetical protein
MFRHISPRKPTCPASSQRRGILGMALASRAVPHKLSDTHGSRRGRLSLRLDDRHNRPAGAPNHRVVLGVMAGGDGTAQWRIVKAASTRRVTSSRYTDELAPNSSWLPGASHLRAPIKEPVLLHRSRGLHARDSLPEEVRRFGEFVQLSRDTAALKISSPRQRHRRQRPRGQRPLQRPWRSLSRCRACSKKAPPTCRRGAVLKRFRRARDALGSILIPE